MRSPQLTTHASQTITKYCHEPTGDQDFTGVTVVSWTLRTLQPTVGQTLALEQAEDFPQQLALKYRCWDAQLDCCVPKLVFLWRTTEALNLHADSGVPALDCSQQQLLVNRCFIQASSANGNAMGQRMSGMSADIVIRRSTLGLNHSLSGPVPFPWMNHQTSEGPSVGFWERRRCYLLYKPLTYFCVVTLSWEKCPQGK